MNIQKWIKNNSVNLENKKVVVTGATGGLGKEICYLLAECKADIILACRNVSLAKSLTEDIKSKYPNTQISIVQLDLSSLDSVNSCITELKKLNGIDILINNAGVYNTPLKQLDSGYNNIFQINFLYTYYLTRKLLPELEKKENSRCVTLGSVAHNYSQINTQDIDFSNNRKNSKIYGNSKRFLMFALYDLFKDSRVKLAIVHPGVTLTNMTNHYPKAINWLVKIGIKLLFPSPKQAVLSVMYGLNHDTTINTWIGPSICNVWGKPQLSNLDTCDDLEYKQICQITHELYSKIK